MADRNSGVSGKSMYLTEAGSNRRQLSRRPATSGDAVMAFGSLSAKRSDLARPMRQEGSAMWCLGPDASQAASIEAKGKAIEVRNENRGKLEK